MNRLNAHRLVVPLALLLYVIVALFRWATWKEEMFFVAPWKMFSSHPPRIQDYGVRVAEPAGAERLELTGEQRILASRIWLWEVRHERPRVADHFRALLEPQLFDQPTPYVVERIRILRRTPDLRSQVHSATPVRVSGNAALMDEPVPNPPPTKKRGRRVMIRRF